MWCLIANFPFVMHSAFVYIRHFVRIIKHNLSKIFGIFLRYITHKHHSGVLKVTGGENSNALRWVCSKHSCTAPFDNTIGLTYPSTLGAWCHWVIVTVFSWRKGWIYVWKGIVDHTESLQWQDKRSALDCHLCFTVSKLIGGTVNLCFSLTLLARL